MSSHALIKSFNLVVLSFFILFIACKKDSGHPFYIKTVQGTGTDNLVSGVTGNGATNGAVTFRFTTAGTYYYQCSLHNGMFGTITVQ